MMEECRIVFWFLAWGSKLLVGQLKAQWGMCKCKGEMRSVSRLKYIWKIEVDVD